MRLSNYNISSFNKFDFSSLTLYNFKVSEDTFNALAQANIEVEIEGHSISGKISMNRLLLAKDFACPVTIPLVKTVVVKKQTVGRR